MHNLFHTPAIFSAHPVNSAHTTPIALFAGSAQSQRKLKSSRRVGASALVVALMCSTLAGCSLLESDRDQTNTESQISVGGPKAIQAEMPPIPDGLDRFYTQNVNWESCKSQAQCAKIEVPLNYAQPSEKGKTIEIALKKRPADQKAIGTLLVNPGGPGGSGQEMIDAANYYFPDVIRENFDIIGFDPRGVGESAPIDCLDDAELARVLEASYPDTEAGQAQTQADVNAIAAGCKAKSGDLLPFVGTKDAARDLDVIRHLVGDPKLYYLGYSYGTSLGGMYADLFPKNVGRMVLDGAVSSNTSNFEQTLAQMKGFEQSLDAYLTDCLSADDQSCPFTGSVADAREQISYVLKQTLSQPVPGEDGRVLTQSALLYGIVTALYDDATWQALSNAFTLLIQQRNPEFFLMLFDSYIGRDGDEFINNSMEANWAINCADYGVDGDAAKWEAQSAQLAQESPIFGALMEYDDSLCAAWAYQPETKIQPFKAAGSEPIVVVGTTGDPATPYKWAEDFVHNLDNGILVTWEGEGHTAYGHSTACIDDAINSYLLNGTLPAENLTCPAK